MHTQTYPQIHSQIHHKNIKIHNNMHNKTLNRKEQVRKNDFIINLNFF